MLNCSVSNDWAPATVTLPPALPPKTATDPFHPWVAVPVLSVQLVPDELQVPAPPAMLPLPLVCPPFQNCRLCPAPMTDRVIWPAVPMSRLWLPGVKPDCVLLTWVEAKLPDKLPS